MQRYGPTMILHFDDAEPVAQCRTQNCTWHAHGDSIIDATTTTTAWARHVAQAHREDWNDD